MATAYNLGDSSSGMGMGDTIRAGRKKLGWSQAQLAREVGISQPAIKKIEAGDTVNPRKLIEICAALNIPLSKVSKVATSEPEPPLVVAKNSLLGQRDLPVYAAAEGGNGTMVLSSDPVDWVRRPAPLANVRDGYGIIIINDSMKPEFKSGDTALVHPHLPPTVGEAHVFYSDDGHGLVKATIKSLERVTQTHWHVEQWHPPKRFSLAKKEWQTCHLVVGRYMRRGS